MMRQQQQQQRFFVNDDVNKIENEMNNKLKKSSINDQLNDDTETSPDTSVALSTPPAVNINNKKPSTTNQKNLWSRITFKFRFVQHFMKRAREKRNSTSISPKDLPTNQQQQQQIHSRTDIKPTGSIKFTENQIHQRNRNYSIVDRKMSTRSFSNELRSRIRSESDKDSSCCTDDDFTINLFEINSNTQLNTPNSIKSTSRFNDYLYLVNSDNETIDLFNKHDKFLTTHIDMKLASTIHTVRTPVDLISTNSNLFVTDWLNDEVLVYNNDCQLNNILSNNNNNGMKYFSSPWGITIDPFSDYLYVCNTDKNTIEIFDSHLQYYQTLGRDLSPLATTSKNKQSSIEFHTPKWIVNCDHWGLAVSDWDSNEIKLIDHVSNQVIRTIRGCYNPEGLCLVERTGTQLLVLCSHHKNILKLFDILSGKLIKTYDLFSGNDLQYQKYEPTSVCSVYGLRGLCYADEKIYFTDSIKNKIFICNL
jgi:hypothetical protein